MPATYTIDKQRELVLGSASGVLTFRDIIGLADRLRGDRDFLPAYRELFDFTGMTRTELSSIHIQSLAKESPFAPSSRRAFLVTDELAFGIGRMSAAYHELHGERNISVFRDKEAALRWLETGEQAEQ